MSTNQPTRARRKGAAKAAAFFAVAAIAIAGAFSVQAVAESKTYRHIQLAGGFQGGWHAGGHARFSDLSRAEREQRITRFVRHVSIEIDATPEQEQKIIALLTALASEVAPMRESMMATREEVHALLTADRIDRAALEKIRAERVAEFAEISKTVVNAMADVAEVLTPEQRRVLEERIREFRSMFGGHGHDGRRDRHHRRERG